MGEVAYDKKVLRRLAMFTLNRKTDDLSSELYEYLVMTTISDDKLKKGLTKTQIVSAIAKDLGVVDFPNNSVTAALGRMTEKRFVEVIHNRNEDLYFLSQDKFQAFEVMGDLYSKILVGVKKALGTKISKAIGTPIDLGLENGAFSQFQKILGTLLSTLGEECCYAIVSSKGKLEGLKTSEFIHILNKELSEITDEKIREAEKTAILDYLSEPDEYLSDYLFSLAQSYFMINVLHIDPECNVYTKKALQETTIFLDTNVLMHALVCSRPKYVAADTALKISSKLGVKLILSKLTKEEFEHQLINARKSLGTEPKVPPQRFRKIQRTLEDGLLKDFLNKKQKEKSLTFDGYISRLEQVTTLLENKYSVLYDENEYKMVEESSDFENLKETVIDEGKKFFLYKSEDVAKHDAFHILPSSRTEKRKQGRLTGAKVLVSYS